MADVEKLKEQQEKPTEAAESTKPASDDMLNIISNLKEQLANQSMEVMALAEKVQDHDQLFDNMQINIDTDINDKYGLLDARLEQFQEQINIIPQLVENAAIQDNNQQNANNGGGNLGLQDEVQQKLLEQNQLIGMLDEQINTQDQQIQQMQANMSEIVPEQGQIQEFMDKVNEVEQMVLKLRENASDEAN